MSLPAAIEQLKSQRDAITAVIDAFERCVAVGVFAPLPAAGVALAAPVNGVAVAQRRGRRARAVSAVPPPRTRRAGETTAGAPPDVPRAPAETNGEGPPPTYGQYDQRILACVKLAPPLGMTAKDVVKGVAGKKAAEAYGTVWSALNNLAKRGLIAKDGRYYRPIEAEQEDSNE